MSAVSWSQQKPGVHHPSALAAGLRTAYWPTSRKKQFRVLAFAAYLPTDWNSPVAYVLYRADGENFPQTGKLPERKTHLVKGSRNGLIIVGTVEDLRAASVVWKCEGLTDAITLAPHLPAGQVAVTNSHGAKAFDKQLAEAFREKRLYVIHDADEAGQLGATRVAQCAVEIAAEVRCLRLPYKVQSSHGKDLRDYFSEGGAFEQLAAIAAESPVITETTLKESTPDRVTNAEVICIGETVEIRPLEMNRVLARVWEATNQWPRRVGRTLFVHDSHGVSWLESPSALFGWLQRRLGVIEWHKARGCVAREDVYHELRRTSQSYLSVENLPHEPPLADHYYAHDELHPGDGSALNKLLDRFEPATELDRQLMKAAMMTVIWGGKGGTRPCFVITADSGRGAGKSKFAEMVGRIAGGVVGFSHNEDISLIKTRLLSIDALPKRVALLDNVKSLKFSWAELEALITAPEVSGKRMYVGEATRPNTLTWFITLNGASLSTDMSQRAVVIKLAPPKRSGMWEEETTAFILDNGQALLADLIGALRVSPVQLDRVTRWGTWEKSVLARLQNADKVQALIQERQGDVDAEGEEAEILEEFFAQQLERLEYATDREEIFIPSSIAAKWFNWAHNESAKVTGVARILKQLHSEGRLHRIQPCKTRTYGRGFVWTGDHCDAQETMKTDIQERLAKLASKRHDA